MADETTQGGVEAKNVSGALTSMRLDELVSNLAIGIARGQMALDQACMEIAQFMSQAQVAFGKRPGSNEPDLMSLIELGFTPNFYQFVDTVLELRVSVSTRYEEKTEQDMSQTKLNTQDVEQQSAYSSQSSNSYGGGGGNWGWSWWGVGYNSYGYSGSSAAEASSNSSYKAKTLEMTTVDAKYASTYNYAVEASSVVKTKIVPVPPPTVFEEIVRAKVQERREWEKRMRLTEEARAVLQGQVQAVAQMLAAAGGLSTVPNSDNAQKAAALRESVTGFKENHDSLTNEHWALGRSVADRAAADARVAALGTRASALKDFYAAEVTVEDPTELLSAFKADLEGYKTVANTLLARLAATGSSTNGTTPAALRP